MSDKEADEFYAAHGYPFGEEVNLAWLRERVDKSERRLMVLSAKGAPPKILENERRIIARQKGWITAWLKEHLNESLKEAE